ncbi:integrase core domain protein [Plakobranchus ocellatus]|uniref:Integrase core domain protein n=1 Tax=Plakobranchus ocellatus TaxID=259542 RepID=A0AAV4B1J1_9GAST|nr:integrase core domain protein [Plakobranchus ocellatus]
MVHQDRLTKFLVFRALKTKRAEKVAYKFVPIFTLLAGPTVLQSVRGRESTNKVVSSIKGLYYWPILKISYGKPRHSQSQGNVERADQHVVNMLCAWMKDANTGWCSEELRFVQLIKYTAFYSGMKKHHAKLSLAAKLK